MTHRLYRIRIQPQSAFATPLRGDTLFGQCCQLISESSQHLLAEMLEGYTAGSPFLVLSDAFPAGCVPRPGLPLSWFGFDLQDARTRKDAKGKQWLPVEAVGRPMSEWENHLQHSGSISKELEGIAKDSDKQGKPVQLQSVRTHNSINRLTSTTSSGIDGFAPFERQLTWYHPQLELDIYAVADERLPAAQLQQLLEGIGAFGYGKEASTGCGRFKVESVQEWQPALHPQANAWLTLGPCAPQGWQDLHGNSWHTDRCFYQVHVRFGKHAAGLAGQEGSHRTPWKNPVLMADRAALLSPAQMDHQRHFCGQGLSGLSHLQAGTVHQGYSPVLPVYLDHTFEPAAQGAQP